MSQMDEVRPIFSEDESGNLVAMKPSAPPNEDALQELIADFPEIVSEQEGELLLIRREQGIPGEEEGSDRWSLDHLFVSRNAVPVLIEVKRASDTRIRREVIGQLLDYAANGVAFWPAGTLESAFQKTSEAAGEDADTRLDVFLGGKDASEFWTQVDANLSAGRIRLVVAADVIPSELARVIEFLNEQMKAEVRAVELRYFESSDGRRLLVPRIIGETERSKSSKGGSARPKLEPISLDDWVTSHMDVLGPDTAAGVKNHLDLMKHLGAEISVTPGQSSVYANVIGEDGKMLSPMFLLKNGTISLNFGWTYSRPGLADEAVRQNLFQRFSDAVGGLSTANIKGHPAFPASRLSDPAAAKDYEALATEFVELAKKA